MLFKVLEAFFKHGKLDKPQIPLKPLSVMIQMTKIIVPESKINWSILYLKMQIGRSFFEANKTL